MNENAKSTIFNLQPATCNLQQFPLWGLGGLNLNNSQIKFFFNRRVICRFNAHTYPFAGF